MERGSTDLSASLAKIPTNVEPDADKGRRLLTEEDSPLRLLWRQLNSRHNIGWVTAGKLCARKRPAIAPVYDKVIRSAVGRPDSWWGLVTEVFAEAAIVKRLEELLEDADQPGLTRLRVLDIAIWMRQHGYQWLPEDHPGRKVAPLT